MDWISISNLNKIFIPTASNEIAMVIIEYNYQSKFLFGTQIILQRKNSTNNDFYQIERHI